jgi:pre-mRNA-processing factor 6
MEDTAVRIPKTVHAFLHHFHTTLKPCPTTLLAPRPDLPKEGEHTMNPPPPPPFVSSAKRKAPGNGGGPPPGYIPGIGRGAFGFTTRGDVAPIGASAGGAAANEVASEAAAAVAAQGGSRSAEARAARMAASSSSRRPYGDDREDGGRYADANENEDDDDDDEADRIWAAIDERMKHRKKKKKKNNSNDGKDDDDDEDEDNGDRATTSAISAQFRSLKEQLALVTEEEWAGIPDAMAKGDASLRHKLAKKKSAEHFVPVSDSLLLMGNRGTSATSIAADSVAPGMDDTNTSGGMKSTVGMVSGLSGLSAARGAVLTMSLDRMQQQQQQPTNIGGGSDVAGNGGTATSSLVPSASSRMDAEGYLTSLAAASTTTTHGAGTVFGGGGGAPHTLADLTKARLLLQSVRETNPNHGAGWIASARVEEAAGNLPRARKIIQQATDACSNQPDVWLEAARLHPIDQSKRILATAVRKLPNAVSLFLHAAKLEHSVTNQREVLRKGLTVNPTSLTLWKAAIELEDSDEAALALLRVATDHVPHSVELWLALAKLESYENAQKVLNKARKSLPNERSIWMAAAKLEESQNHHEMVDKIVHRAVSALNRGGTSSSAISAADSNKQQQQDWVVITREQWLQEATTAESSGHVQTAAAIIKHTLSYQVDDEDRQLVWADEARAALVSGHPHVARAILSQALQVFPQRRGLWRQAAELEMAHGNFSSLDQVLEAACERLPTVELFWLLRAKEQWKEGRVDKARQVLTQAFAANPESQEIWLAAAKLERENGEVERARVLLERARERASSERVYMKSALLEREQGNSAAALKLIEEGITLYPKFAKLYMMGGQICSMDLMPRSSKTLDRARKFYQRGLEQCPDSVVLWTLASRLEEKAWMYKDSSGDNGAESQQSSNSTTSQAAQLCFNKARGILDLGRLKNPKNPQLWLESTRLERRAGNFKLAETFLAKALQECPNSGLLLAEDIYTCPRVKKKSKSSLAIQRCPEDPLVICAVATFFASERKTDKARKWFARAVVLNADDGDAWARYYAFEMTLAGNNEQQLQSAKDQCIAAAPKHGELWTIVSKDMGNRGKSAAEILELVAAKVQERNLEQQHVLTNPAN